MEMNMGIRRKIVIGLLGIGTVVGFGTGFASVHHHRGDHREEMARNLAAVCVESALAARGEIDGSTRVSARDGDDTCGHEARIETMARRLCAEEGRRLQPRP